MRAGTSAVDGGRGRRVVSATRSVRGARTLLGAMSLVAGSLLAPSLAAAELLVLEFELNDLTLYPDVAEEKARAASLRPLLVEALTRDDGLELSALPDAAAREAARGVGYVFERPSVAARLGRASGADWVLVGRLHKASHLFVYLKAQLVAVDDRRVAADFVVELKGRGERLTRRGVETLAEQVRSALDALAR